MLLSKAVTTSPHLLVPRSCMKIELKLQTVKQAIQLHWTCNICDLFSHYPHSLYFIYYPAESNEIVRYRQESPWEEISVDVWKLVNLRKIAMPWEKPEITDLKSPKKTKNNCATSKASKKTVSDISRGQHSKIYPLQYQ